MLFATILLVMAVAPMGLLARYYPKPGFGWVLALLPLAIFSFYASQIGAIGQGNYALEVYPWAPGMNIDVAFRLDGLSLFFVLLVSGIGTLIVLYTSYYMKGDAGMGRFYLYLLIFMGAMLGLVLSENILTMFVFWELTSVSSYLLVGYKHDYPEARRGAQMGLLITFGGGLGLLVGLVMLGQIAGSYNFSDIIAARDTIVASPLYAPALGLILLGAFTKSAQFPFHFWLPNAMQAPTPASAFLHSATMVKAGVFLLARLNPALGGTDLWMYTLTSFGMVTMVLGAIVALRKDDIKGLLAYSTVSKLGTMVMLVGVGGPDAAAAVMATILAHALYKGALFMLAGVVDHEAGTRSLSKLGGLGKIMPWTMALTVISSLSMAGIPILLGFVSKEEWFYAATASPLNEWFRNTVLVALVISSVFGVAYAWRLVNGVFLGQPGSGLKKHVHEAPLGMLVGPGVLTVLSLGLVAILDPLASFLTPAVTAMDSAAKISLYLFPPYFNFVLALSLLAIGLGVVLTRFERALVNAPSSLPAWLSGDKIYDATMTGLLDGTTAFTRVVQNGKLRHYLAWSLLTLLAAVGVPFLLFGLTGYPTPSFADVELFEVILALLIPIAVLATIRAQSRLGAIIAAGVVGAIMSFIFVIFSAPDLALVQLTIEVLATVFMMLVFAILPAQFRQFSSMATRMRDGVIAVLVGLVMAAITFAAASSTQFASLAPFFREQSQPAGQGANVVNVIIVDFRGFDTMGEITVLFGALLGIYGLVRMRQQARASAASKRDNGKASPANGKPTQAKPTEEVKV
ncbi:MAG: DUF4040 domain-containing protein [Chloroflexaceae bacterium]|jgi:multicomponent Na+:H+ antiporter subunit A|nr:DUF4040 domain-containing protein [Chloroflexaceae bacterium]